MKQKAKRKISLSSMGEMASDTDLFVVSCFRKHLLKRYLVRTKKTRMTEKTPTEKRAEKIVVQLPSANQVRWFRTRLSRWFVQNKRAFPWRTSINPYLICIAEVLLQQTSADRVAQV